jgi:hypothetical protein
MRALLRYSAGGLTAIMTMAYISVSAETGLSAFRSTVIEPASPAQTVVNRLNKGDREARSSGVTAATAHIRPVSAVKDQKILEGCDPAFSPLTASAKNNYANRCMS